MISQKQSAILYMLSSCVWAAVMVAIVRHLSESLHPFLIVFFRNFVALLFMLPWVFKNGIGALKTRKIKTYITRAIFGLTAMFLWFYSLSIVPLSQAVALSFTAPLFSAIWAVIFLKEKTSKARISCLLIGFIGTIIILQPGTNFSYTSLFVLLAASMWSMSGVIIKSLTRTEKPEAITFYMVLMMAPLSLPAGIIKFSMPEIPELIWIIVLGFSANIFQISLSKAFSKADLGVLLPFDFTRLIFASVIAYFFFNEVPNFATYIGAVVILCSAIYMAWVEAKTSKKPVKTSIGGV